MSGMNRYTHWNAIPFAIALASDFGVDNIKSIQARKVFQVLF